MNTQAQQPEEKIAGTNLTTVPEYTQTALGLADLRQRHGSVVYDVTVPKEMKAAKEARAELRTLRTTLEKTRKDIKAPALERCRLIDAEAKRLTEEIASLEDPIDAQIKIEESRKETERLEALAKEQARVDGHRARIAAWRNLPGDIAGRPLAGMRVALSRLEAEAVVSFETFEEFSQEAEDVYVATIARVKDLITQAEDAAAEAERVRKQDEENAKMRAQIEAQQRELDAAREREEQRQREAEQAERERVADAERAERERVERINAAIADIVRLGSLLDRLPISELESRKAKLASLDPHNTDRFDEFFEHASAAWDACDDNLDKAIIAYHEAEAEQGRLRAAQEDERQRLEARAQEAAVQAAEAAQERREAEARAEEARLSTLTMRTAMQALVDYCVSKGMGHEQPVQDALGVLMNSEGDVPQVKGKRQASKVTKAVR